MQDILKMPKELLKNEAVLSWPAKNEASKNGFERKAFTGFQLHTIKGVEEVKEFGSKDNYIIKGDNLTVLHSIKDIFKNRVKLIYLDPPYNTGNNKFNYHDDFDHTA